MRRAKLKYPPIIHFGCPPRPLKYEKTYGFTKPKLTSTMFVGIVSRAAHTDTSFSQSTVCITDGTKEPFTESQLHHRTAPYSQKLSSLNYNTSKQLAFERNSRTSLVALVTCYQNITERLKFLPNLQLILW